LVVVITICLQHFQLTYSACIGIRDVVFIKPKWLVLNPMIIALLTLLVLAICNNLLWSLIISSVFITLLSISNYYITLFHGTPFFASDIFSAITAINVVKEYRFQFSSILLRLLAVLAFEILVLFLFRSLCLKKWKISTGRKLTTVIFLMDGVLLWGLLLSPWKIFSDQLIKWEWTDSVIQYGYELCLADSFAQMTNLYNIPEGYSSEKIDVSNNEGKKDVGNGNYPDIIIIINESLCDLSYCSIVKEGAEVLKPIRQIPGIISGYSTASLIGGGTNNSEYEVLTSNSMAGLKISAPFLMLNMNNANSIVSYLESLGYYSVAMHPGNKTNYGRNTAYPALGFSETHLGHDEFTYQENGNRPWYDSDNYKDMESWYEKIGNNPRFMYLLTFQNHGGYEQNGPEYDTIEVKEDFGEYTDDINEYLTSMKLSAEAFTELVEYYSHCDRDTVILMVGDHAPAFIKELPCNDTVQEDYKSVAYRTVPYYVWSNIEIEKKAFSEHTSMVDLVPMLLKCVKIPLSAYYKTIIELNKQVPVRISDGLCVDQNNNVFNVNDNQGIQNLYRQYTFMEYNNLNKNNKDEYLEKLFIP